MNLYKNIHLFITIITKITTPPAGLDNISNKGGKIIVITQGDRAIKNL